MIDTADNPGQALGAATEELAYEALQFYTLARTDPAFIHQYVVDAWALQHADERTKPIKIAFALVGLYLHVERGFSGRQVQRVHTALARNSLTWPTFALPAQRGSLTVSQVIAAAAGPERDRAIDAWCASVWDAFRENRPVVIELLDQHRIG